MQDSHEQCRRIHASRRRGKARIILIVVVAVAVVAAAAWWMHRRSRRVPPPAAAAPTVVVEHGDLLLTVEATGSVASNLDVEIKSKASGRVVALPYDVSDHVPAHVPGANDGKALVVALDPIDEQKLVQRAQAQRDAAKARLDQADDSLKIARADLESAALRAKANLASAQARAELADIKLDKIKGLYADQRASKDEFDNANADQKVAHAQVDAAQADTLALEGLKDTVALRGAEVDLANANLKAALVDLADAEQRLADTRIFSPIDGVVTDRKVNIGQIVASGIVNVGGGTAMMVISDLSRVFVVASVDESDIGRLIETEKVGQDVDITVDAYPGRHFSGQVERITPLGVTEAKVVSFIVKIEVTGGGKELLKPRMTANVTILANRRSRVLLAPNSAISFDGPQAWVNLLQDGRFVRRNITLGLNDGLRAEVVSGLSEGDAIEAGVGQKTRWSNVGKTRAPESQPD